MVYLRLTKIKTEEVCNTTHENVVMISHSEISLNGCQKVQVVKSNGQCFMFDVVRSDAVHIGNMSMSRIARCTYRLHIDHRYWVEGYQYLTAPQSVSMDPSKIGILGQDEAIEKIMWSVFKPRQLSVETRRELNMCLPRGVLLYGPPGTGKTGMIRGLCNHLHINPTVVNGPDFFRNYVGDPQLLVRAFFDEALRVQNNSKAESPLHVIVFDGIESLFYQRSPSSDGKHNSVVTQMVKMMDEYTPFDNLVVFGTTDRIDLLDSALLHSGRFDLQIKMDVPDAKGRFEILKFYINRLRENARLTSDVTDGVLATIAEVTTGYSGADLAGVVRNASLLAIRRASMASERNIKGEYLIDESKIMVNLNDITIGHQRLESHRRMN